MDEKGASRTCPRKPAPPFCSLPFPLLLPPAWVVASLRVRAGWVAGVALCWSALQGGLD